MRYGKILHTPLGNKSNYPFTVIPSVKTKNVCFNMLFTGRETDTVLRPKYFELHTL
jgi:hypothetical protein